MKKSSCKLNDQGFTLIEMAVVMIIIGIVISTMVTVLPTLLQTAKRKQAKALLEKYDSALQGYAIANSKLPFADNDGDGREDTDTFVGTLPYITLGLSAGDDSWKNSIRYAVYGESGGANNITSTDVTTICTVLTAASTAAFDSNLVYTTDDDTNCAATNTNSSNKAYVLASGGPKDLNAVAGFFDGCNGTGVGFNSVTKIQTSDYDDIVISFSLVELINNAFENP
jgi:prepilin-type N-terminal cleavage/methylation domain-containing protein